MEVRFVKAFINVMSGFLLGMMVMARFYCNALDITSGNLHIGWDTIAITCGALAFFQLLIRIDPSFKESTWDQEHAEDHYDEYGVNTRNSFNTPPKNN
jgi:hypothetical protein